MQVVIKSFKKEIEEKRQSCIRNLATIVETQEKQWSFSVSRLSV